MGPHPPDKGWAVLGPPVAFHDEQGERASEAFILHRVEVGIPGSKDRKPASRDQLATSWGRALLKESSGSLIVQRGMADSPTGNPFTVRYMREAYNRSVVLESDFRRRQDMFILKRAKRLWTLLTTEEVFREDGTSERRAIVRRSSRI